VSGCRFACRVALRPNRPLPRVGGVGQSALATKVFHYSCQPFCRRLSGLAALDLVEMLLLAGVWKGREVGGDRRVARRAARCVTALICMSLVTKESSSEGVL
jgi:hypothetical protein